MSLLGRGVMAERRRRLERAASVKKATKQHHRVSPEGEVFGASMARIAEKIIAYAATRGLPDQRCASCAFRPGTVPNGCLQTQNDAFKAVLEGVPFMCHASPNNSDYCYGWAAARCALYKAGLPKSIPVPWDFSPPDPA